MLLGCSSCKIRKRLFKSRMNSNIVAHSLETSLPKEIKFQSKKDCPATCRHFNSQLFATNISLIIQFTRIFPFFSATVFYSIFNSAWNNIIKKLSNKGFLRIIYRIKNIFRFISTVSCRHSLIFFFVSKVEITGTLLIQWRQTNN